jgi:hypothetical protein
LLTFQRSFSIGVFAAFKGNVKEMSLGSLSELLSCSESEVKQFYSENVRRILNCLMDFAESYVGQSYFQNYLPLYVKTDSPLVNNDFLFLKETAYLYNSFGENFALLLDEYMAEGSQKAKES